MEKRYVVGIDLGGTKIAGALVDLEGNVIRKSSLPTNAWEGEKEVSNRILKVVDELLNNEGQEISVGTEEIKAIGIGSPGPLDVRRGMILNSANLPFQNFNVVALVEERYKIKTYLDNDANVAAIGENVFGAGIGTENMIYITISTGIGGGAIINGKIYRGSTCNALEIGHITVMADGPKCNCGNHGCAEALASGTGIGKLANKKLETGVESSLNQYEKVTSKEVFIEAAKGDKIAEEILENSLNYFGICVANAITIFDPEMIVIGGGVSKGGKIVFDTVNKVVKERCFPVMVENCKIVPAALGEDAGAVGAAALAIMESK